VAEKLIITTVLPCGQTTNICFLNKTTVEADVLKQSRTLLAHGHSVISKTRTAKHAGCQVCAAHLSHCQVAFSSFQMKHTRDTQNLVFYF